MKVMLKVVCRRTSCLKNGAKCLLMSSMAYYWCSAKHRNIQMKFRNVGNFFCVIFAPGESLESWHVCLHTDEPAEVRIVWIAPGRRGPCRGVSWQPTLDPPTVNLSNVMSIKVHYTTFSIGLTLVFTVRKQGLSNVLYWWRLVIIFFF